MTNKQYSIKAWFLPNRFRRKSTVWWLSINKSGRISFLTFQESWMTAKKCHSSIIWWLSMWIMLLLSNIPDFQWAGERHTHVHTARALQANWLMLGDQAALLRGLWHSPCHAMRTNFLGDNIFPRARVKKDVLPPRQIFIYSVLWSDFYQSNWVMLSPHCFSCCFLKRWFPESN